MTRTCGKLLLAIVAAIALGAEPARAQNSPGPQAPEDGVIRRQPWLIPAHDRVTLMRTTVYWPPGAGPFPLAVVNHGSSQNEIRRARFRRPDYRVLAQWLVARGYAVAVPQRPGHGETGGPYYEDQGRCAEPDFRKAGHGAAASIAAAIEFMVRQPFVRATGTVAFGHSAGGWGALAIASHHVRPLAAAVAFAPGRGGRVDDVPGRMCAPERLIAAARSFGEKSRVPTLWLYAENDSYFPPAISRRLAEAFRLAGGRAEYRLLPASGDDGHELVNRPKAVAMWGPIVERFLKGVR